MIARLVDVPDPVPLFAASWPSCGRAASRATCPCLMPTTRCLPLTTLATSAPCRRSPFRAARTTSCVSRTAQNPRSAGLTLAPTATPAPTANPSRTGLSSRSHSRINQASPLGECCCSPMPFREGHIGLSGFGPMRCMFRSNFPVDRGMFRNAVMWSAFKPLVAGFFGTEKAALFEGTASRVCKLQLRGRSERS
jgi:hypothetical protein